MYPQERFAYHKRQFWPVLCLKRIGLSFCTFVTTTVTCSLQIILLSNYSVTYNFSTCRHYLAENHLPFPSAPHWVRHSYLSKRATIDPIYLWVIRGSPTLVFWEARTHDGTIVFGRGAPRFLREGLIISGCLVQVRTSPKHRSTHISNYQSSKHKLDQHDESD